MFIASSLCTRAWHRLFFHAPIRCLCTTPQPNMSSYERLCKMNRAELCINAQNASHSSASVVVHVLPYAQAHVSIQGYSVRGNSRDLSISDMKTRSMKENSEPALLTTAGSIENSNNSSACLTVCGVPVSRNVLECSYVLQTLEEAGCAGGISQLPDSITPETFSLWCKANPTALIQSGLGMSWSPL